MTGVMTSTRPERPPRDRMVYSAAQLLRTGGVAATGVRDVVERAHAPRGSFQHYFPAGKDQLVGEAVRWAGGFAADRVRECRASATHPTPAGLMQHLAGLWQQDLTATGFTRGCPMLAAAADLAGSDSPVNDDVTAALEQWRGAVADELVAMDVPARRAPRLAALMISALEGAIVLSRIEPDVEPLAVVAAELAPALDVARRVRPAASRSRGR